MTASSATPSALGEGETHEVAEPFIVSVHGSERGANKAVSDLVLLSKLLTAILLVSGPIEVEYEALGQASMPYKVVVTTNSKGMTVEAQR